MEKLIFYLNGQFVPDDEAKISVLDLGFSRSFSAFEFIRTYKGKPFKLEEHLQRLKNSCDKMSLSIDSLDEIKQIVLEVLAKNKLPEAVVKIYVTGGKSNDGITPIGKSSLIVVIAELKEPPKEYYENGIKVVTVDMGRRFAEIKSTDYISAILAKKIAHENGAIEAIYKNSQNELLEATQCNFFCFKGDDLITAKEGVLMGITRGIVLELAAKEFNIDYRPIKYNELKECDETFISASSKEIVPVVQIDDIIIKDGKVGERTKRLMKLFKEYTK